MIKIKSINFLKEKEIYLKNICKKLASLKTAEEISDFLDRLLTKNEVDKIARRLGVAKRLMDKLSYTKISTDLLDGSKEFLSSKWIRKRYPWHFVLSEILKSKK